MGRALSTGEFAAICLRLQELGAENINIVTGSHAVPAIVAGLECARSQGMRIPVLWNSSGYDGDLSLLEGVIDGYLPDLKTLDPGLAAKFFNAPDYPEHAVAAILRMLELKGSRKNAVIIRHLVLPGHLEATREALRWFAEHCQGRALLSVMTQYTPLGAGAPQHYVNEREYDAVLAMLEEFGIEDGFYQELNPGDDWLPDFTRYNPFSSELSVPVWHWSREVPNHATTE
jgi:putative pyruvate formate lyase activating enzyme